MQTIIFLSHVRFITITFLISSNRFQQWFSFFRFPSLHTTENHLQRENYRCSQVRQCSVIKSSPLAANFFVPKRVIHFHTCNLFVDVFKSKTFLPKLLFEMKCRFLFQFEESRNGAKI